jgi:hypothetical protein
MDSFAGGWYVPVCYKFQGVNRVSSPKQRAKSSVNQQVKAGLSAIKDFLAGRSTEAEPAAAEDKETREVVAAELVAAMSGQNAGEEIPTPASADVDSSELAIVNANIEQSRAHEATQSGNANSVKAEHAEKSPDQERERARQLFLEYGYFDEAVHNLRAGNSPADRAAAARALGLAGSRRATAHLIAAMFDEDPEVRHAAENAIRQIDDPTVADLSTDVAVSQNTKQTGEAASPDPSQTAQLTPVAESQPVQIAGEAIAVPTDPVVSAPTKSEVQELSVAGEVPRDRNEASSPTTSEADQLLIQEQSINQTVAEIGRQVFEMTTAFKQLEDEVRLRTEREAQLRAEAIARRNEEEDERKRAEEAIAARRAEEQEALKVEQAARAKAEAEAQRLADEEAKLRLKAASLRLDAAEVARRRADLETARKEAAEAARQQKRCANAMRPGRGTRLSYNGFVMKSKLYSTRRTKLGSSRQICESRANAWRMTFSD